MLKLYFVVANQNSYFPHYIASKKEACQKYVISGEKKLASLKDKVLERTF